GQRDAAHAGGGEGADAVGPQRPAVALAVEDEAAARLVVEEVVQRLKLEAEQELAVGGGEPVGGGRRGRGGEGQVRQARGRGAQRREVRHGRLTRLCVPSEEGSDTALCLRASSAGTKL